MTSEAKAIGNALLDHHRIHCRPGKTINSCIISYGNLCNQAGLPSLTRVVGNFLIEIADWCSQNNFPPLNSLAVNSQTNMPGDNYKLAPGCSILNWSNEVQACINFTNYPTTI